MYAKGLQSAGPAARRRIARPGAPRSLGTSSTNVNSVAPSRGINCSGRGLSSDAASRPAGALERADASWRRVQSKFVGYSKVPSPTQLAGAVALFPVIGGAWLISIYALRQRLCERHLQQVEGDDSPQLRRRVLRVRGESGGGKGQAKVTYPPLFPGSSADARGLREMLEVPASGVTVLCVDAPASYTGDAFLRSALLGRAATVHIRAGEGDGDLAACLARGLGVDFMTAKLQMAALVPAVGERRARGSDSRGRRGGDLSDIGFVLDTATSALEEIKNQAFEYDPRSHLPPVIVIDGLLSRIHEGEDVPACVETVLKWCWSITGGRRLAHVILTAPQSMVVDGSLVRVKALLNGGRPSPGMMRTVALDAPDTKVAERRFRARFTPPHTEAEDGRGDCDSAEAERAVNLCMELVHDQGCGVAEEANMVLRRATSSDENLGKHPSSRLAALETSLELIALEAWRRASAAIEGAASYPPDESVATLPGVALRRARSGAVFKEAGVPLRRSSGGPASADLECADMLGHGAGAHGSPERNVNTSEDVLIREGGLKTVPFGRTGVMCVGGFDAGGVEDRPPTPLGRVVKLLGDLADGDKMTVGRAISVLGGDGQALGRLLDLGVLRLSPQTALGALGASGAEEALTSEARPLDGVTRSPDVLAEATVAFQVGAATPIMSGIFAILRGCHGAEEREIVRAINLLRSGASGRVFADSKERDEWQARREAVTSALVRRVAQGQDHATGSFNARRLQADMSPATLVPFLVRRYQRMDNTVVRNPEMLRPPQLRNRGDASVPEEGERPQATEEPPFESDEWEIQDVVESIKEQALALGIPEVNAGHPLLGGGSEEATAAFDPTEQNFDKRAQSLAALAAPSAPSDGETGRGGSQKQQAGTEKAQEPDFSIEADYPGEMEEYVQAKAHSSSSEAGPDEGSAQHEIADVGPTQPQAESKAQGEVHVSQGAELPAKNGSPASEEESDCNSHTDRSASLQTSVEALSATGATDEAASTGLAAQARQAECEVGSNDVQAQAQSQDLLRAGNDAQDVRDGVDDEAGVVDTDEVERSKDTRVREKSTWGWITRSWPGNGRT